MKRKFALTHKLYYEFGNKAGKLLANALQKIKVALTIHAITSPTGASVTKSEHIAQHFVRYLSSLYNLPKPLATEDTLARTKLIDYFLTTYGSPPIPGEDMSHLGSPITTGEALLALKQLKTGKSQDLPSGYYKTFSPILIPKFVKAFNALPLPPHQY